MKLSKLVPVVCLIVVLGTASLFIGCSFSRMSEVSEQVAQTLGLTDAPPLAPITVDVICDSSSSACNADRLASGLSWGLEGITARPNSKLRLFGLGDDLGSTRLLKEVTSTASPSPVESEIKSHQERWRAQALEQLMAAATPLWNAQHRGSPVLEVVAAVAQYPATGKRFVVIISDLLQESAREVRGTGQDFGHFECGQLPSVASWTQQTKHLFEPLKGAVVLAAFASPIAPIAGNRCAVLNERYAKVKQLWESALTAGGATVFISADKILFSLKTLLEEKQ